jgi:hypothetical protein
MKYYYIADWFSKRESIGFFIAPTPYIAILSYAGWLLNFSGKEVNRDV